MTALLPIMMVVLSAYLVIGIALPVLPLHVHHGLGLGTFLVGLVAGSQFAAAVISRMWAGHLVDRKGPKYGVSAGLIVAAASGALYVLSLRFSAAPYTSVAILLAGRALLGVAESVIITGALSWGVGRFGPQHTGKVMSWVGTALYAAFAVGAPAGTALYGAFGFGGIAAASALLPIVTLALVLPLRRPAANGAAHERPSFMKVIRAVSVPGIGLAMSGVGFGAIMTFIALLFAERGWSPVWLAFTAFSLVFILARMAFGHLPDRVGGARVALVCVLIEAMGLAAIWVAPTAVLAFAGVTLSGLGYSLVYPGLGVEALRSAPPESRGVAMGAYTAFLDVSLGLAGPVLGFIAGRVGLGSVFLISTIAVLCSSMVPLRLMQLRPAPYRTSSKEMM